MESVEGKCSVCGCHNREHKHSKKHRYEAYEDITILTDEIMENCYNKALKSKKDIESIVSDINQQMNTVHLDLIEKMHKAKTCLQRLREIALKPDFIITDVEYINLLIQSEKEEAKEGYQERIEHLKQMKMDVEAFHMVSSSDMDPELERDDFFQQLKHESSQKNGPQEECDISTKTANLT